MRSSRFPAATGKLTHTRQEEWICNDPAGRDPPTEEMGFLPRHHLSSSLQDLTHEGMMESVPPLLITFFAESRYVSVRVSRRTGKAFFVGARQSLPGVTSRSRAP